MESEIEVVIVGAGVAGSFLACNLTERGCRVTICDPAVPREKPCGGWLRSEAFARFPLLRELSLAKRSPSSSRYLLDDGSEKVIPNSGGGVVISRHDFDSALLQRARCTGAKLLLEKVLDFGKGEQGWWVQTKRSILSADILVGADGARSIVRKKLIGAIPRQHLWLTVGYFLRGVSSQQLVIKLQDDLVGYLGAFPRIDHVSICSGAQLGSVSTVELIARLDDFVADLYPTVEKGKRWTALLPMVSDPALYDQSCVGDDWLLVGDAAGHVHPINGEGMFYALAGAKLAAEAIIKSDLKGYDQRWREDFGRELVAASSAVALAIRLGQALGVQGYPGLLRRVFGLS